MNTTGFTTIEKSFTSNDHLERFFADVIHGLSSSPKKLHSKYFYDAKGDKLFQQIMDSPEYYLTNCEMEILSAQSDQMVDTFYTFLETFDVIELGAGDASKSIHLLKSLLKRKLEFTYFPIDISGNVIHHLEKQLPIKLPGLNISGLHGEYISMLRRSKTLSDKPKLVLFMGANIGNIALSEAEQFCKEIRLQLSAGDMVMIGFDLKKNPKIILDAYNDAGGITKAFNLNLLYRINRELDGNFNPDFFDHYPTYDPLSGACKSYLISLKKQITRIGEAIIHFDEYEPIHMEISQKYSIEQTDKLATLSGFKPVEKFFDSKKWFVDCLWEIS